VFDATPAGGCGATCNLSSALTTDGAAAGLDCEDPSTAVLIDSINVTACVAADFGAVVNLDPVTIRARAVANACGRACTDEFCNTGNTMIVFYGNARGVYQWAREVLITRSFADYSLSVNVAARYVVVCRGGSGSHRDDVQVDSIRTGNACM
jgi:hypothetical protein